MAVVYKCLYCGRKRKGSFVFEGPVNDVQKYIDNMTKELSEKCECKTTKAGKDIKLYMCQDEYNAYKNGESAYGIMTSSYRELLAKYGAEMLDLNIIVKVRPKHILGPIEESFGTQLIPGWYEVKRVKGC
jgi:hypothetical protein